MAKRKTPEERFHKSYQMIPEAGCWLWDASFHSNGYGRIFIDNKSHKAHRYSWKLHNGPIPKGMCVCHKCDVKSCVNPEHLFLGTHQDNVNDCISKNRRAIQKSENSPNTHLTWDDISEIRKLYKEGMFQKDIGKIFNISQIGISNICNYKRWRPSDFDSDMRRFESCRPCH